MFSKLVLLVFVFFCSVFAQENFTQKMNYQNDFQQAVKVAIDKYKPLMFTVVSTSCPWCKKFENQTLQKKEIDSIIQTNFTPLLLNKDIAIYPKETFDAKVVPTTFFIDPLTFEIFHQVRGYKSPKKFLLELEQAKNIYYKGK